MPESRLGSTIWFFVKLGTRHADLRFMWRESKIAGETSRSWIAQDRTKIPKKGGNVPKDRKGATEPFAWTAEEKLVVEAEYRLRMWLGAQRWAIAEEFKRRVYSADVTPEQVLALCELIGSEQAAPLRELLQAQQEARAAAETAAP